MSDFSCPHNMQGLCGLFFETPIAVHCVGSIVTPPSSCSSARCCCSGLRLAADVLNVDEFTVNRSFLFSTSPRRGFAKNFFTKSGITMEVGEWVQISLGIFVLFAKSSQNSPKPVLIFWSSIPCLFCRTLFSCKKYKTQWSTQL